VCGVDTIAYKLRCEIKITKFFQLEFLKRVPLKNCFFLIAEFLLVYFGIETAFHSFFQTAGFLVVVLTIKTYLEGFVEPRY
jgi:hypothetical protein